MRTETTGPLQSLQYSRPVFFSFFSVFCFLFPFSGNVSQAHSPGCSINPNECQVFVAIIIKIDGYFAKILVGNCLGENLTREPNSIPVRQFGCPATTFTDLAT